MKRGVQVSLQVPGTGSGSAGLSEEDRLFVDCADHEVYHKRSRYVFVPVCMCGE
jgi:hypothetical protein